MAIITRHLTRQELERQLDAAIDIIADALEEEGRRDVRPLGSRQPPSVESVCEAMIQIEHVRPETAAVLEAVTERLLLRAREREPS